MKKLTMMNKFVNRVAGTKVRLINDDAYYARISCADRKIYRFPTLGVPKANLLLDINDEDETDFRNDFIRRYPQASKFSTLLLVLIHEIGHLKTVDEYWADEEMEQLDIMMRSITDTSEQYFLIPSEYGATEWAINWLKVPQNQKIAKYFEKQFYRAS